VVTPGSERSLPSPNLLRNTLRFHWILYTGLSPPMVTYSTVFYYPLKSDIEVLQPQNKFWFGLFPVRSSLTKGISYDFFSSAYLDISVQQVTPLDTRSRAILVSQDEVSLFGHRRIITFTQLPGDFRGARVLHRPNKPRHPLCALIYIFCMFFLCS
jgi:hypothetical protein